MTSVTNYKQQRRCVLMCFLSFLVWGCFEKDITFESYIEDDIYGKSIDCSGLITHVDIGLHHRGFSSYEHDIDFIDFMRTTEYEFNQCNEEIKQVVDDACQNVINKIDTIGKTFNGEDAGLLNDLSCKSEDIERHIKSFNSQYTIPSDSIFITLLNGKVSINSTHIYSVSFDTDYNGLWWLVSVALTNGESVTLTFGDKSKAQEAVSRMLEFANINIQKQKGIKL